MHVAQLDAARQAGLAPPKLRYNPIYPVGTKQPLTKEIAVHFFSLLSTCDHSLVELLRQHPELPPYNSLDNWRRRHSWFSEGWRKAREQQAEFLVQKCLDIAEHTDPKNAHAQRVKFDIYWKVASKFSPSVYGDKSQQQQQQTTVNVGIAITPERLNELRSKLDDTRRLQLSNPKATVQSNATTRTVARP